MKFQTFAIIGSFLLSSALAQDYASVGALQHDSQWEVGVHFQDNVDITGAQLDSRYVLQGADVRFIRYEPLSRSVVIGATARPSSIQLTGFTTTNGTTLAPVSFPLPQTTQTWSIIGANELGFRNQAIAYGNQSQYDLISGAVQLFGRYDEAVFMHEQVTGNFDIKVRVVGQEPSTFAAKAGLMIRESLNAGQPRPADSTDPAQAFSRYISVQVNPATTVSPEEPGNNQHEVAFRPYLGGIDSPADPTEFYSFPVAPQLPNAWLRLSRNGNTVTAYRGIDGQTWTVLGEYTFPAPALTQNLQAGIFYSPEVGNIPPQSGERRAFIARFADYMKTTGSSGDVRLAITKVGNQVEVSWNGAGTLQSTETLSAPQNWQDVTASSPHRTTPQGTRFYRLQLSP